jgi:hypothetical protein
LNQRPGAGALKETRAFTACGAAKYYFFRRAAAEGLNTTRAVNTSGGEK